MGSTGTKRERSPMKSMSEVDVTAIGKHSSRRRHRSRSFCLPKDTLSPRETEDCLLLREGLIGKEIGAQLGISHPTAEAHRRNLYIKLGVSGRAELFKRFETQPRIGVWSAP